MTERGRRISLTRAQLDTPAGRELFDLLRTFSQDGRVTHEEAERLRMWLDTNRNSDLPACEFLRTVVEGASHDDQIAEAGLSTIWAAVEKVLPPDARLVASLRRKEYRAAERKLRTEQRAAERAAEKRRRDRDKRLAYANFMVAGATRSSERREACESVDVGDQVHLEREPDNPYDRNAIRVLTETDSELGYVPRGDAAQLAPLLDAHAQDRSTITKLLTTADGYIIPVVTSQIYGADAQPAPVSAAETGSRRGGCCGCLSAALVVVLVLLIVAWAMASP